jgi:hypothetical protein
MDAQINVCAKLKTLKGVLPKGAMKDIAEKANMSYTTVTMIFKGYESKSAPKVLEAAKELLTEKGILLDPFVCS